jgi:putative MATE family efflux protein
MKNKDLTIGDPKKVLISFTIPLFISVVFQQLYSIADSVIAGKFAGESALAAIGASYPITMIFMAVAVGSQIGCSVVISRRFGSGNIRETKSCITTALAAGSVLSIILTVAGVVFSPALMSLVNTPDDIFASGNLYLKIYTGGFVFLYIYNVTTGIFNSLGDSKTPLIFLIGSSVGNIILDAVFVIAFKWGVAGTAWATFIAQGVSCILSVIVIIKRMQSMRTDGKCEFFSVKALKEITAVAIPSILQQSFISVGNMFVQYIVNGFGSSVIAGYSAAIKLNTFAITGFTTLGNGVSSFTAQNLGAGKIDRVKTAFKAAFVFAISVALVFFVAYFFFGREFLYMFMNEDSTELAMETGLNFLRIVSPFYVIVCMKLICDGVLRGSESMGYFMATTFTDLILRVVFAFIFSGIWGATGIWIGWPISWIMGTALSVIFYCKGVWMKKAQSAVAES